MGLGDSGLLVTVICPTEVDFLKEYFFGLGATGGGTFLPTWEVTGFSAWQVQSIFESYRITVEFNIKITK